jgi:hypothetical protein
VVEGNIFYSFQFFTPWANDPVVPCKPVVPQLTEINPGIPQGGGVVKKIKWS